MKKVNIYILTLFLPWFLLACDDYLKEDSDDLLIPSLVNDYVPILLGEGYPDKFASQIEWIHLMTDDVEMGPLYYDESMYNNSKVTFIDDFDPGMGYGEMVYTWWADYSQYITDNFWDARYKNILACNIIVDAFLELQNKGVDVVINDTPVNEYYVNGKGKGIAKVTGEDYDAAPLGIAVKKGNAEVLNKINDGLAKIKANGKYAEIYKKWFGKEPPAEDLK